MKKLILLTAVIVIFFGVISKSYALSNQKYRNIMEQVFIKSKRTFYPIHHAYFRGNRYFYLIHRINIYQKSKHKSLYALYELKGQPINGNFNPISGVIRKFFGIYFLKKHPVFPNTTVRNKAIKITISAATVINSVPAEKFDIIPRNVKEEMSKILFLIGSGNNTATVYSYYIYGNYIFFNNETHGNSFMVFKKTGKYLISRRTKYIGRFWIDPFEGYINTPNFTSGVGIYSAFHNHHRIHHIISKYAALRHPGWNYYRAIHNIYPPYPNGYYFKIYSRQIYNRTNVIKKHYGWIYYKTINQRINFFLICKNGRKINTYYIRFHHIVPSNYDRRMDRNLCR